MKNQSTITNPRFNSAQKATRFAVSATNNFNKFANLANKNFAPAVTGVATLGNTATYMVAFLLPDTR